MKTKIVKVCLGIMLLASCVLLVSNVSFAQDDNTVSASVVTATTTTNNDGSVANLPSNLVTPPLQSPQQISLNNGGNTGQNGGQNSGGDNGNSHRHPSPCK